MTNARIAHAVRAIGLAFILWSVLGASPGPGTSGRGLVITILITVAVCAWFVWWFASPGGRAYQLAVLTLRLQRRPACRRRTEGRRQRVCVRRDRQRGFVLELRRAAAVALVSVIGVALGAALYDRSALSVLAYSLGFAVALLGASNGRQARRRADENELLLVQMQRSREEQLRAARLEEQARIAREIHDVLAHALAGLAIQLEATRSLIERGAERDVVLERVSRAHALAREGLDETRRAIGALRGEPLAVSEMLEALVSDYRSSGPSSIQLSGPVETLQGQPALTVIRVAQEALTNVRKHAPGAEVRLELAVTDQIRLLIEDHPAAGNSANAADVTLAGTGGGYGLRGMRERAEILGGSLSAGPVRNGWQVELTLPASALADGDVPDRASVADAITARRARMTDAIRVLIADDQGLVRDGLATLLGAEPGIEVVATARDGEEAVALVERHRPDVVLMDLRMPQLDGVEATRRIRAAHPDVEVVVLTTYADDASILDALQAGARGYLTKDAGVAEITRAVQAAAAGQALLDPAVQQRLLAAATAGRPAPAPERTELPDELTAREAEVLRLIAAGLSNGEIADRLVISEATVKTHVNHVFAKTGARDRAQAVHYAYRHGLAD